MDAGGCRRLVAQCPKVLWPGGTKQMAKRFSCAGHTSMAGYTPGKSEESLVPPTSRAAGCLAAESAPTK
jgi:hypothetical protein